MIFRTLALRVLGLLASAASAVAAPPPGPGEPHDVSDLGLELAWIAPGKFQMGSPASEPGHEPDERQHAVRLTEGFWIGRTEITVGQWRQFVQEAGFRPSDPDGGIHVRLSDGWRQLPNRSWREPGFPQSDRHPVVGISWEDAVAFGEWLTRRERAAGRLPDGWAYALPTEAMWEYACRAGTTTPYSTGEALSSDQANFGAGASDAEGRSPAGTRPVASFGANPWGLFDCHGNVWEWCADAYGEYPAGPLIDPTPIPGGKHKVKRGGSWIGAGENCRSANRNRDQPGYRSYVIGFRIALRRA